LEEGGPVPPELKSKIRKSDKVEKRVYNISCFPLETMLAAVNNPVIDYFSLDVEGFEMKVRSDRQLIPEIFTSN